MAKSDLYTVIFKKRNKYKTWHIFQSKQYFQGDWNEKKNKPKR